MKWNAIADFFDFWLNWLILLIFLMIETDNIGKSEDWRKFWSLANLKIATFATNVQWLHTMYCICKRSRRTLFVRRNEILYVQHVEIANCTSYNKRKNLKFSHMMHLNVKFWFIKFFLHQIKHWCCVQSDTGSHRTLSFLLRVTVFNCAPNNQ